MLSQSWQEFLNRDFPEAKPIFSKGLLNIGGRLILFGREGSLKSMLGLRAALAVANGEPWLHFETPHTGANVLYINAEVDAAEVQARAKLMHNRDTKSHLRVWNVFDLMLDRESGYLSLATEIEEHNIQLIIIDPLFQVMSAPLKEEASVKPFKDNMDRLLNSYPCSLFIISHARKHNIDEPANGSDDNYGSALFNWWAESILRVDRIDKEDDSAEVKVSVVKKRSGRERIWPIRYRMNDDDLSFIENKSIIVPISKERTA